MSRHFQSIELTRKDALALRELIRPYDGNLPDFAKPPLEKLAMKVYASLIELEREDLDDDAINIGLDETECLLLNQKIGNEDWEGALPLLRQTWAVLYEIQNDMPPGRAHTLDDILRAMDKEQDAEGSAVIG